MDANGCSIDTTVNVPITVSPVSTVNYNNVLCYQGNSGVAQVKVISGGIPRFTYLWSTSPAQNTEEATGLSAGTYSVLVTDANGCTSSNTVTISQPTSPVSGNIKTSGYVCDVITTAEATISSTGGTGIYTYLWQPGGQTTNSISNLKVGAYTVTVTDANGCTISKIATILPSILPTADFSFQSIISCEGISVQFINLSSQASSSLWDFGDKSPSGSATNPSHVFPAGGTYTVSLNVSNPPCKDTKVKTVSVNDFNTGVSFGAANVFSPNGDGRNDCFHPSIIDVRNNSSIDSLASCISLTVYDRWGVTMFESDASTHCWDGNDHRTNKLVNDGTYYYIARFGNRMLKGSILLVQKKE